MNRKLLVFPGAGDHSKIAKYLIKPIEEGYSGDVEIVPVGFRCTTDDFDDRLAALKDKLASESGRVDILGSSAGGSVAIWLYSYFPDEVNKVVVIRSPVREFWLEQMYAKLRGLHTVPYLVELCNKRLSQISSAQRSRILTISCVTDWLVPPRKAKIDGAENQRFFSIGHYVSSMTGIWQNKKKILSFLRPV